MAVPTGSSIRLKPKEPLDSWSVREKLCLASAVFKIGDQNWVSVSRAIRPYAESHRPPEWFHQKNCLRQYYDLLEQLEQPKRKRGGDKSESDSPSLQIMRRMTIERSEQLKKEIVEMQQSFKQLKAEVDAIKTGQWDDRVKDVWEEIQREQKVSEEQLKTEIKVEDDDDASKASATEISDAATPIGEIDDSTQDSLGDISVDEDGTQSSSTNILTSTPVVSTSSTSDIKLPTASHLLSSLLKSDVKTATGLQQLKIEQEQYQQLTSQGNQQPLLPQASRSLLRTPVTQDDPLSTTPSSSKGQTPITSSNRATTVTSSSNMTLVTSTGSTIEEIQDDLIIETVSESVGESDLTDIPSISASQDEDGPEDIGDESSALPVVEEIEEEVVEKNTDASVKEEINLKEEGQKETQKDLDVEGEDIKEEVDKDSQDEDEDVTIKSTAESLPSEAELTGSSVKDEPLSPTSSISSRISESGGKKGRSRGRPRSARSRLSTRKSYNTDDDRKDDGGSSRHSDVELSEDDGRESDGILTSQMASVNASSILSESFPNSPASVSICSDTEEEKSFKQWKKSIMLVWRAAATHKYANVFLHPVTDEIAPGYRSVVLRPMDLSTIKKNVELGSIRTTVEFQRDMMLMFTNAIMYNSSDHNVYKMAMEMYDDVMQHIEMMIQTTDAKNLRQSRRPDASDKEDDVKKRRLSVEQSETGGKTKKRKTRLDESLP